MTELRVVSLVRRHPLRSLFFTSILAFVLLSSGCTRVIVQGPGELAAVAPQLSVERFLQASNARDYAGMARLFGTPDGPIADTGNSFGCGLKLLVSWLPGVSRCRRWEDVELQMAAIAEVLRYQDYRIVSEAIQPGRTSLTNRIGVDLHRPGSVVRDVPFLVVRTEEGRWLVQEIDLERITRS
jgi:hypothetical protein